ncbi:MAG: lysoplasmalogenase [Bacteroidales bacterium]|nr:lysoplasmalogenase [Bacteroidales bacterium]
MTRHSKYQVEKVVFWTALILFCVFAVLHLIRTAYLKELLGNPTSPILIYIIKYKIAIPTLILTLSACRLHPKKLALAFFFCAVGDYMGAASSFIGQMAGFTVAHVLFICAFYSVFKESKYQRGTTESFFSKSPKVVLAVLSLVILFALVKYVPNAGPLPIKIGVLVYVFVISAMALTSFVASSETKNYLVCMGGSIFVLSDFILAMHRFLYPDVRMKLVILIPYYLAILLIWIGTVNWKRKALC